ncbi:MAG: acetyl-CoA carboxylase biotin carboxyl carrier protein [Roseovarius sp.]|nr:acetyl-CoA carboxylase biotin carboxyl carrier protein [Roseovarius sp.]MCY4208671.1 acetyl-CoA carboxylase biotin carboxyl carrier protein [Roseovarius sp.]MCY4292420.1 acetyl-CoA carboxylase biotin carboxyl carrier protein [Roseovarius sp.]MCY4316346.1 acetyl-CoA carboxylase biotin carboxyl carrier protein [Roseovarius sp.]
MPNKTHTDDVTFIKSLAELLNENNLTELQVTRNYGESNSLNVRISRRLKVTAQKEGNRVMQTQIVEPSAEKSSAPEASNTLQEEPASLSGTTVTSPMVGTIYLQAEPGAPSFVKVGDQVSEGQTLLIIEAMKTMNHIHAPHSGTVKRILTEDGAAVEYGAPLVIIE